MIITRRAEKHDIDSIMKVISDSQKYLASMNIDQWQDGFPERDVICDDVQNHEAYVMEDDGKIAAYFVFFAPPDPVYSLLEDGSWQSDNENYGTIHRTSVAAEYRGRGLGRKMYEFCIARAKLCGYSSVRVDTHPDNSITRHFADVFGFVYCGVVYYPGNLKRIAFEKLI